MDCMQSDFIARINEAYPVSIPQAVWIACNAYRNVEPADRKSFNTASGMDCMQYCLPEPLKTVNPKGGFLVRLPFCTFPQTSGNFLSQKVA